MNIVGIVMLIATIVAILIVLAMMVIGFFKGWKRSLLGLCRTASAAVLAFLIVLIVSRVFPAGSLYSVLEAVLGEDIPYLSESEALQTMGGTFVYTFAMPYLFSQIFLFFDLILLIPAYFVAKALGIYTDKKKLQTVEPQYQYVPEGQYVNEEQPTEEKKLGYKGTDLLIRFGGAGIKLVTSFIVIVIMLLPLSGLVYTLTDGVVKLSETAKEQNISIDIGESNLQVMEYTLTDNEGKLLPGEFDQMVDDVLGPIRNNIFMRLSYCKPMRAICNAMTATSDSTGQARNEVVQLFDVACDACYFLVEPDNYGEEQKNAVSRIIEYVSGSELHSQVAADLLTIVSEDMSQDNGEDMTAEDRDLRIILDPLFEILENTTAESISADLNTLRDIIITVIDYDLPATIAVALEQQRAEDIIEAFANEEFLYDLFYSLYHNDDYRHMTGPVIDYAFTVIVRQFDPDVARIYVAAVDENYTDESIRQEAKVFASIFADAKSVMDIAPKLTESGDSMAAVGNTDFKILGHFVDNARESQLIGSGVTTVLITVLESRSFDSMRAVADILVKHIREDDDISIGNLFGAVQQFVSIMSLYENSDGSDTAELASALRALNESCDDRTAVILKEIIDDSNILNAAILSSDNAQKNDSANKVLSVMLDKLTTGEYTDEQFETEAKAVDYTMKLVQANSNNDIKALCGTKEGRRDLIDMINSSEIASSALIAAVYEDGDPTKPITGDALSLRSSLDPEDIANIREECKEYYQEKVKADAHTAQLDINLKTISAVFDCNISDADLTAWAAQARA